MQTGPTMACVFTCFVLPGRKRRKVYGYRQNKQSGHCQMFLDMSVDAHIDAGNV